MTVHKRRAMNQNGYTLIELLVAVIITSLLAGVLVSVNLTIIRLHDTSSSKIPALGTAQNIGHWLSQDALMAQSITTDDDTGTATETEVVTLRWLGWPRTDNQSNQYNDSYSIRYTYDNNELRRHQSITTDKYDDNGVRVGTPTQEETSQRIGDHLTVLSVLTTTGTATAKQKLIVTLTVTVDDYEVTRTYQITPRPSSL